MSFDLRLWCVSNAAIVRECSENAGLQMHGAWLLENAQKQETTQHAQDQKNDEPNLRRYRLCGYPKWPPLNASGAEPSDWPRLFSIPNRDAGWCGDAACQTICAMCYAELRIWVITHITQSCNVLIYTKIHQNWPKLRSITQYSRPGGMPPGRELRGDCVKNVIYA